MKIAVTRSGGFAGITTTAEADTAGDPALGELVDRIDLAAVAQSPPQPDRFVYEIKIGDRTVSVGEPDLSGPLRELVDRVLAGAR